MDESMDRDEIDIPAEAELAAAACGERRVRDALSALDVPAPETLRLAVEHEIAAAIGRRGVRDRLRAIGRPVELPHGRVRRGSLAAGALAALAVALVLTLGGSAAAPTVQQAARAALLPAAAPAPPAHADGDWLVASVDGIVYPTWTRAGWWAVGERTDTLAGRAIRTVLYTDRRGGRVGYAIAAGDALPVEGGRVVAHRGTSMRVLAVDGATVVTWQRKGHTCILASRQVSAARLLTLAGYTA